MTVQIRAEIAALGWKQSDLAAAVGMPTSSLHRYLAGVRDIPLPVFIEIAHALGLSLTELLARGQRRQDSSNVH
ncbi:MAG TPA: helix-turn-helix transcriptional regulator [Arthrobacter sp.]